MKYFIALFFTLSFLAILLFRDIPQLYFFSDDFIWLLDAKRDGVEKLPAYFIDSQGFFYRPVTKIYFWTMWRLVQDNSYWYHIVNILFHFAISLAVYGVSFLLLRRIVPSNYPKYAIPLISIATAVLFFVHPAHLESIIWPSVITELIPALCVMAGLLLLLLLYDKRVGWLAPLVLLLFAIGLGGHEYMVVFPALVYITHLYLELTDSTIKKKRFHSQLVVPFCKYSFLYICLAIVEVGYLYLRWIANSHWSGGDYSYNLALLPFNVIGNAIGYLGLLVVGIPFIDWHLQLRFFFSQQIVLALVLSLLLITASVFIGRVMWKYRATKPFYLFVYCFIFFMISLAPFLGLGGLAERYLYLSSFSLLLVFSFGVFVFSLFIERFTESVADITAYGLIIGMFVFYFIFSIIRDQQSWNLASMAVATRLDEFKLNCESFTEGETLVRISPENRIGRAWFFQVGYEEGANLYCDKNLRILRK